MKNWGYLMLLLAYALIFNTIFATFLPRLIRLSEGSAKPEAWRLRSFYDLELAGFMSGFLIVAFSWNRSISFLLIPYWLVLGLLLYLVLRQNRLTAIYTALALLATILLSTVDRHSSSMLYTYKHGIDEADVVYSVNSPYQKVEVIEDKQGERHLFLDGLENLNSTDLDALNYYIATLPAALLQPKKHC